MSPTSRFRRVSPNFATLGPSCCRMRARTSGCWRISSSIKDKGISLKGKVARSIPNSNTISSGTRSPYCARSPTGFQRSRQPEIEQKLYSKVGVLALDMVTKAKATSASPAKKHVADLRTEQLFLILGGHKEY